MTTLYLIRHAEAEGNLYRRIHGWYDALVTPNGLRQIEALEGRFAGVPVDAVYSSDLYRTKTTAKAVYLPKGLSLHTDPGLREVHMGDWEDHPWGEIRETDGEQAILIVTHDGMAICFKETDVRCMGRDACGVRGISLREGDFVVGAARAKYDHQVLMVTENGYGKRTGMDEYFRADGPQNIAVLADFYHMHVNGDDVPAVIEAEAANFGHIQIADADGRGAPGTGSLPLHDWIDRSFDLGYTGAVALEYKQDRATAFDWLDRAAQTA